MQRRRLTLAAAAMGKRFIYPVTDYRDGRPPRYFDSAGGPVARP